MGKRMCIFLTSYIYNFSNNHYVYYVGLIFSGDVFVGRRGKDKNDHGMNMYGHFIVKSVFLQLIEDYQVNNPETKVCDVNLDVKSLVHLM